MSFLNGDAKGVLSVFETGIAAVGLGQCERKGTIACLFWGLLSLFLFGMGSLFAQGADWFVILVSLLKVGSFLIATVLCWRNASDPDIVSGRGVWQAIALGLFFYALGDITVILWRSLWGITAAVSLGDVFYGVSYLFLALGLLQALLPRQMTLNLPQTLGISVAGLVGILLASWINFYSHPVEKSKVVQSTQAVPQVATQAGAQAISVTLDDANDAIATNSLNSKSAAAGAVTRTDQRAPALIQTIEQRLSRIARYAGLVYVVGDCALVVMAAALLVAFWGGSYSQTWRLVALAGICLYIADMFLMYEIARGSYEQGAIWEFFWVLSALFFGLSAGVEKGISTQMKARSGRREWL